MLPGVVGAYDHGRSFEERAIQLARAIHDPSGVQGSIIVDGSERDALFVDEMTVFAYEFTTRRDKAKATQDGKKLASLLVRMGKDPVHRYKSMQARFVTESEPTAEQRAEIDAIARQTGTRVIALSVTSLRKELVNTEDYLALRLSAPFGSAGNSMDDVRRGEYQRSYVPPTFSNVGSGTQVGLDALFESLCNSSRIVLRGDFGIGKSAALAELFTKLRTAYFKRPAERRFPVHINLRDMRGLRSAREVLTRHSQELGFPNERGLISAWRAGACDLLLDGFDELVPTHWVGGVRDLASVRKSALEPVRQLINETPSISGIIAAGRTQYFSSDEEIVESLGMRNSALWDLLNFSDEQVRQFLGEDSERLPEWVPSRPVLLQFWMQMGMDSKSADTPGQAWREFLHRIARREGERIQTITSSNFLKLLRGVATACQADSAGLKGVSSTELAAVFYSVFGREPDDEGLQTLMRLPGLVPVAANQDYRRFLDEDLEQAAFGLDVAAYIVNPDASHALSHGNHWSTASSGLVAEAAAAELVGIGVNPAQTIGAIKTRMRGGYFDAPLLEIARCADLMDVRHDRSLGVVISGTLIPYLNANGEGYSGSAHFADCLIEEVDLSSLDLDGPLPEFSNCIINLASGQSLIPERLKSSFNDTEVARFSSAESTTDGIMSLTKLAARERVALSILKKLYSQRGSGRKLSALSRGLPPQYRDLVPEVLTRLVTLGFAARASAQSTELVLPVKARRSEALRILENISQGVSGF